MTQPTLTKNRQAVLDALAAHPNALSAYSILDRLHAADTKWKPATVYRALNYLIDANLIHRIESEQKYICCAHDHSSHEKHFMICDQCGQVSEQTLSKTTLGLLSELAKQQDFSLRSPYLEFRGRCADCKLPDGQSP